jgi:hypothetical protein
MRGCKSEKKGKENITYCINKQFNLIKDDHDDKKAAAAAILTLDDKYRGNLHAVHSE